MSEGSSVEGSPGDKQLSAPYIRGGAKISQRVTLAHYTGTGIKIIIRPFLSTTVIASAKSKFVNAIDLSELQNHWTKSLNHVYLNAAITLIILLNRACACVTHVNMMVLTFQTIDLIRSDLVRRLVSIFRFFQDEYVYVSNKYVSIIKVNLSMFDKSELARHYHLNLIVKQFCASGVLFWIPVTFLHVIFGNWTPQFLQINQEKFNYLQLASLFKNFNVKDRSFFLKYNPSRITCQFIYDIYICLTPK